MDNILLISDAAKAVQVESHVLRYWEEELQLPIRRNELGHRFYTKEDVERFKMIKNMKERGLQLKAIKMILKDGKFDVITTENAVPAPPVSVQVEENSLHNPQGTKIESDSGETREEKAQRLQWIMQQLIRQAVRENNTELAQQIGAEVATQVRSGLAQQIGAEVATQVRSGLAQQIGAEVATQVATQVSTKVAERVKESMLKELDYQFRMQEEREEERTKQTIERTEYYYQRMDELLRRKSKKRQPGGIHAGEEKGATAEKTEKAGEHGETPDMQKPKRKLFHF